MIIILLFVENVRSNTQSYAYIISRNNMLILAMNMNSCTAPQENLNDRSS